MYYFIERAIVVVKPKQLFLDWVHNNLSDTYRVTMDNIRLDCNTYLIDPIDDLEDGVSYIDEKFADIFMMELATWTDDKSKWPQTIDLKMFWEWFDVEVHSTLIDLSGNSDDTKDTIH
jgi:hypothetical protein